MHCSRKSRLLTIIALLIISGNVLSQDSLLPVHDPVMIRQDSTYYIFGTGQGIAVYSSTDRKSWKAEKPVFNKPPQWALDAVPGFWGHIWAPDIYYFNGLYYLYYSVSAFGKNTSCIGVATNPTLDARSPAFNWTDHGKLIQSVPGRDMWNAIDPNLIVDGNGTPWLSFGSFWNGIKLVRLDSGLRKIAEPEQWYTIASRPRNYILPDSVAGDGAIEAPFIIRHGDYYYLFVSFDYCCRGEKSTYKLVAGRSRQLQGPYTDKEGIPMNLGGGSILLEGDSRWHGVGHNAIATFNGVDYLVFHGYDAKDKGRSKLILRKLAWINGWPLVDKESR